MCRSHVQLIDPPGEVQIVGGPLVVPSQGVGLSKVLIFLPQQEIHRMSTPVTIGIYADTTLIQRVTTSFLGPVKQKHEQGHERDEKHEREEKHE